jgi:V8-like Glu-specific endopeptidase
VIETTVPAVCVSAHAEYRASLDDLAAILARHVGTALRWRRDQQRRTVGRVRPALVRALAASVLVLAGGCAAPSSGSAAPPSTESAPDPAITVGPLFKDGNAVDHGCTASVVDSPAGDLLLTAAHCVVGTGAALQFVPGYDDGAEPEGAWTVMHTYADPAWIDNQDDSRDFAILQVADQDRHGRQVNVEAVTGGNQLGMSPDNGSSVKVIAYNAGHGDEAKVCTATVRYEGGYPTFDCPGFTGGSSGSPWLTWSPSPRRYVVHAVIGGLRHGGCLDTTSYSSPFDGAVQTLLDRAATGTDPDTLPQSASDNC